MKLPIYQIDAFTSRVFSGNPAAVCPLPEWLPEPTMQAIAAENNLAETAFFVKNGENYELRWFTPTVEVDLCGHATLASAFLILTRMEPKKSAVRFHSKSGTLTVAREGSLLALDFPSRPALACQPPAELMQGLGAAPLEILKARDYLVRLKTEEEVKQLKPDIGELANIKEAGIIVTAPGLEADFVSRFFAPAFGIPEDPVTGSAHCTLIPYWAKRLNKTKLVARQVSTRGGELYCEDKGERVKIAGEAALYLEGEITI